MNNDLLEQVQSWSISNNLKIKKEAVSQEEIEEAKVRIVGKDNITTKQLAVINDILGNFTRDKAYHTNALDHYVEHISDLVSIFARNVEHDSPNFEDEERLNDISACFVRIYTIYKLDIHSNKDKWNTIINVTYVFLVKYYTYIHPVTFVYFLLLTKPKSHSEELKNILCIYFEKLLYGNNYELYGWIFSDKLIYPECIQSHLFTDYNGNNNLDNIIQDAKSYINKLVTADQKAAIVNSYLEYIEDIRKCNNGFVLPPPDWMSQIACKEQKNIIKEMLDSISHLSPYDLKYSDTFCYSKSVQHFIETVKNCKSLPSVIKAIIDSDSIQLAKDNTSIFENLVGPGNVIVSLGRSRTGETYYEDSENIWRQKLNSIYKEIFKSIPYQIVNSKNLQDLLNDWPVIKSDFYPILGKYLKSVLDINIECWQKEANINQIVLLIEPILASLNPTNYAKLVKNNKHGCVELIGVKYTEFVKSFFSKTNKEQDFLLKAFIDHRKVVAHGKTYTNFGSCYFSLVAIMKLLYSLNQYYRNS